MSPAAEIEAFLLSIEWRDGPRGVELTLWASSKEHGPVRASIGGQEAVMFVPRMFPTHAGRRESRPLRTLQGATSTRSISRASAPCSRSGIGSAPTAASPTNRI